MVRIGQLLSLLCLLVATVGPAFSADSEIAGAVVLVSVGSEGAGADTVRRVVLSSVELYVDQEGLLGVETDLRPSGEELERALVNEARDADADFILLGLVSLDGSDVTVSLSLFLVETSEELSRALTTVEVGLTLDRAIAGLTGNVLEQARPYLIAAARERRDAAGPRTEPDVASEPDTRTPRDHFVDIATSFAPLVPVADAARYLGPGMGATAVIHVLPFPGNTVGVGVRARAVLTTATGIATSADLLIAPIGLSVGYTAPSSPFVPFARLAGGVAYIRATHEVLGEFESVVPYANAEIGTRFVVVGPIALEAFVGFEACLEESLLILGFAPSIGVALRF